MLRRVEHEYAAPRLFLLDVAVEGKCLSCGRYRVGYFCFFMSMMSIDRGVFVCMSCRELVLGLQICVCTSCGYAVGGCTPSLRPVCSSLSILIYRGNLKMEVMDALLGGFTSVRKVCWKSAAL